jgi:copper(I)-binding protein
MKDQHMKMIQLMSGLLLGASLISATSVLAADIMAENAWSRAMPPTARVLPVYVTLRNNGAKDVSLVSVSSSYGQAELHQTIMENDIMKMLPVNFIAIGSKEQVKLAPMGLHVMIKNLALDVPKEGNALPLTLNFDNGETISLDAKVTRTP